MKLEILCPPKHSSWEEESSPSFLPTSHFSVLKYNLGFGTPDCVYYSFVYHVSPMSRILIGICIRTWNWFQQSTWMRLWLLLSCLPVLKLSSKCPLPHITNNKHSSSTNSGKSMRTCLHPGMSIWMLLTSAKPQCVWLHSLAHSGLCYTLRKPVYLSFEVEDCIEVSGTAQRTSVMLFVLFWV